MQLGSCAACRDAPGTGNFLNFSAPLVFASVRCNAEQCPSGVRRSKGATSFPAMFGHKYKDAKKIRLGDGIHCEYVLRGGEAWIVRIYGWGFPGVELPDSLEGVPVTKVANGAAHYFRCFPVEFRIPDSVVRIEHGAFSQCEFHRATIPSGVEEIGEAAFAGCPYLKEIVFGAGLRRIRDRAFEACHGLEAVTIPATVERIGRGAFVGCTSLRAIDVEPGNARYESVDGFLVERGSRILVAVPGARAGALSLPEGVRLPPDGPWFDRCRDIVSFEVPRGTESIPPCAFQYCDALRSVTVPDGVRGVGSRAFAGCTALERIVLPDSVEQIGSGAFSSCTALAEVRLPARLAQLGTGAFRGCKNLRKIDLPASLKEIPREVFQECEKLESVGFSNGLETIGVYAFSHCSSLRGAELPDSLRRLSYGSFAYCTSLDRLRLSRGLVAVPRCAFDHARGPETLEFPPGVRVVCKRAFQDCMGIRRIEAGGTVELIEKEAFDGCNSLEEVRIGPSVLHIGRWAFGSSGKLRSFDVDGRNRKYASEDGLLYTKDFRVLVRCPGARTGTVRIRNGVRRIGVSAFEWCVELEGVEIPSGVTVIDQLAFAKCRTLARIELPDGVAAIKREAFADCRALASVALPDSLLRIGCRAFAECGSLVSVGLPRRLVRLAGLAFCKCGALEEISLPDEIGELGDYVFWECTALRKAAISETLMARIRELDLFHDCPKMAGAPRRSPPPGPAPSRIAGEAKRAKISAPAEQEPEATPVPPTPSLLSGLTVPFLEQWTAPQIVRRGEAYQDRVSAVRFAPSGEIVASVAGTDTYETRIWFDAEGALHARCTCPARPRCKHAVALALRCAGSIPEDARPPGRS